MTKTKVITGPEELIADMDRLIREYPREAEKVLQDVVALDIGPETLEECPVETTALVSSWSGSTAKAVVEDGHLYIDFGYGTTYAFWVHEIPPGDTMLPGGGAAADIGRTATHRAPQKWRYLEDPVNRNIGSVPKRMNEALNKILMGGG